MKAKHKKRLSAQREREKVARKVAGAREVLRYYDAAQSSNYHKAIRGGGNSADSVTHNAVKNLRGWARYLDESHDVAIGIFDNLVNRTVGAGLVVEPKTSRYTPGCHLD